MHRMMISSIIYAEHNALAAWFSSSLHPRLPSRLHPNETDMSETKLPQLSLDYAPKTLLRFHLLRDRFIHALQLNTRSDY